MSLPIVVLLAGGAGAAGDGAGAGVDAGGQVVNGSPEAVVVAGRSGTIAEWAGTPRGGSSWRCGYYAFDHDYDPGGTDTGRGTVHYDAGPVDPEPGEPYVLVCFDQSGRLVRSRLQVYDPADPMAGVAVTERALEEARRRLELPSPQVGLSPPGAQLVGVPTWMWIEGPWAERSATASIGAVSATVTARPLRVEWDMGDGTVVTCDAGARYDTTRPPDGQTSHCTHVYTTSSSARGGEGYTVTATVTYDVGWSATTGGGGSLGELTRTSEVAVPVGEAQALIR